MRSGSRHRQTMDTSRCVVTFTWFGNTPHNVSALLCDANASYGEIRHQFLERARTADVLTMTIVLALVACVGCFGNGLVIVVCRKYPSRLSAQRFILAMAIIDFFVCVAIIPYRVLSYHRFIDERACKLFEGLTYFTVIFSMLLLIAIAVDRYHAVCRATAYHRLTHVTLTLISSIACFTLGISIYPGVIAGQYVQIGGAGGDGTTTGSAAAQCFTGICNEDGQDRRFSTRSAVLLYSVGFGVLYVTMVIVVVICYTKVFQTLHSRAKYRRRIRNASLANNESQPDASVAVLSICEASLDNNGGVDGATYRLDSQLCAVTYVSHCPLPTDIARRSRGSGKRISHRRTAKILLLVTVAFIVTWLPFMLMKTHVVPNVVTLRLTFFISNMINPVIYSFTNNQFRENVYKLYKNLSRDSR